ncbi:MAG: hypothetical protein UEA60_00680 [Lachnospiraceae bacterium]|nr:hypothetical protein [Lachnospiraceae bacterium]MEE0685141.1 hypothetical protein [Lachnospiraceae bacterium]
MDNNFNQQAPQQPMYQQAPQQMPQQQMYQQAPQQPVYQPAPKKPMNMKELIAIICAASGAFFAILGTTLTCSCSASKTAKAEGYTLSAVFIVAILASFAAAAGIVLGIMALKEKDAAVKAGKLSQIAIAVGVFGVIYALIPTITICGYNCSLQSNYEELMGSMGRYF